MSQSGDLLGVVDIGISNLGSVMRAFQRLNVRPALINNAEGVKRARSIVLPGVGAFGDGMAALEGMGLVAPLQDAAKSGKPLLGFCLGMQLLADSSEEFGAHEGLGIIPGEVVRLEPEAGERVPNVGWCDVTPCDDARLFQGFTSGMSLYFVHSYHMKCKSPEHVAASISYGGGEVTVAVEHGNIFGLQCHPEKSQDAGLGILDAFVGIVKEDSRS